MESREKRLAKNEALFRDVNERVRAIDDRLSDPAEDESRLWDFLCECGNASCIERISMTNAEYEEVRSDPALFALVPGHEQPDVEDVVKETERFFVVQKHEEWMEIARSRDPRGPR